MEKIHKGRFEEELLNDEFFDSLKKDYAEFDVWFKKACKDKYKYASYVLDNGKLKAFFGYKLEKGPFDELSFKTKDFDEEALEKNRTKITTIKSIGKLKRMSEFALINAYYYAQKSESKYIYLTIVKDTEEKEKLYQILLSHGFVNVGYQEPDINGRSEKELFLVKYLEKNKWNGEPKYMAPLLPSKPSALDLDVRLLLIDADYHDKMFQMNILQNKLQVRDHELTVSHSIKKTFIHSNRITHNMKKGDICLIYRKHIGQGAGFRSCITGAVYIENQYKIKDFKDFEDFKNNIMDTSVFKEEEIKEWYNNEEYVTSLIYTAWLDESNDKPNWIYLKNNFPNFGRVRYPTDWKISDEEYEKILKEKGGLNVQNFITD